MTELLEITRSRLRKELLRLYFTNPERKFYLRELERTLGFPVANIRRELLNLSKSGMFVSSRKGNLVFYKLNKNYPLFKEVESIIFKTIGVEGSLRDIIGEIEDVKVALIYGSFAAGEQAVDSDIDVLIIGKPDEGKLMSLIEDLEKRLKREINYSIYPVQEYKKRFKNNDSFIMNVLRGPKISLKGAIDEVR